MTLSSTKPERETKDTYTSIGLPQAFGLKVEQTCCAWTSLDPLPRCYHFCFRLWNTWNFARPFAHGATALLLSLPPPPPPSGGQAARGGRDGEVQDHAEAQPARLLVQGAPGSCKCVVVACLFEESRLRLTSYV